MSDGSDHATAAPTCCFRCQDQMVAAAGKEGLVRLHFPNASPGDTANLYAHRPLLRCISGVLRGLLGDDLATAAEQEQQPAAKVHKVAEDSSPGSAAAAAATPPIEAAAEQCGQSLPVIPMPGEDPAAWEDALGMAYPMEPGTTVSWDNAKRLLLLADKFDCPLITARVRRFFTSKSSTDSASTELASGLTRPNAFDWLLTFSKCALDDLATECITFLTSNDAVPGNFFSSGLQQKHIEQLCSELQSRNVTLREMHRLCKYQLKLTEDLVQLLEEGLERCKEEQRTAEERAASAQALLDRAVVKAVGPGAKCRNCASDWYCQPYSRTPAPHCVKCGMAKQRGFIKA